MLVEVRASAQVSALAGVRELVVALALVASTMVVALVQAHYTMASAQVSVLALVPMTDVRPELMELTVLRLQEDCIPTVHYMMRSLVEEPV